MSAALSLARQGFEVYLVEKEKELGGLIRSIYYTLEGNDTQEFLKDIKKEVDDNELIQVFTDAQPKEISGYVGNFKTTLTSGQELEHGIVIVASGGEELKSEEYLYGKNENVITQVELEERLAPRSSKIDNLKSVVMIQCVGSRENERPYCSRVCCSESIKNALKIKEANPGADVFVLYRDMRTYGFKEDYYQKAREEGVIFVRYSEEEKPEVVEEDGNLKVSIRDTILGEKLTLWPDIVVLGVATVPGKDNKSLAQMLKVPLNEDGFFLEAHVKLRPVEFATEGVFLCGLAHNPKFLDESITQANAAASRASVILSQDEIEAEGTVATVNTSRCSACGMCESLCAYKAVEVKTVDERRGIRAAQVTEALCKGCGACVASCRSSALDLRGFTDDQIFLAISSF